MKVREIVVTLVAISAAFGSARSLAGAQQIAPLKITFEERSIRVEGASQRGEVVWFSVASESSDYASTTVPRSGSTFVDPTGAATFELQGPVPPHSIWAAVDLATGAFALGAPAGYPLRQSALEPGAIHANPSGRISWLRADRSDLHLLLVRPGVGSWTGRFSEGSPDDADKESDGILNAGLDQLRAIGESGPVPDEFKVRDVLIAIDPIQMDVISFRLQD